MPYIVALSSAPTVEQMTGGISDALTLMGTVLTQIIGQPVLLVFLAPAFLGLGVGIWKMLRRAAKGK